MSEFPRREADVMLLAQTMIVGITGHPTIFTDNNATVIQSAVTIANQKKYEEEEAHAASKLATTAWNTAYANLVNVMMAQRGKAEITCATHPQDLALIGDAPSPQPKSLPLPGQVRAFEATVQGPGNVTLDWKTPGHKTGGGDIRSYIVQRRDEPQGGGEFGPWNLVATVYVCEAVLTGQPRGIQMEYQVIATNIHGQGAPSNAVAVVL